MAPEEVRITSQFGVCDGKTRDGTRQAALRVNFHAKLTRHFHLKLTHSLT